MICVRNSLANCVARHHRFGSTSNENWWGVSYVEGYGSIVFVVKKIGSLFQSTLDANIWNWMGKCENIAFEYIALSRWNDIYGTLSRSNNILNALFTSNSQSLSCPSKNELQRIPTPKYFMNLLRQNHSMAACRLNWMGNGESGYKNLSASARI